MQKDLSTSDFETMVTARVCMELLHEDTSLYSLAMRFADASNEVLKNFELQNDLEAISRGCSTYIIFRPTGRIACKLEIDGIYKDGRVRRPRAILTSRRGFTKAKTMRGMAEWTAKLRSTQRFSKGETTHGANHPSKA